MRTGKTVKYFNEMGHSVDVVTANKQPLAPTLDINTGTAEVHYTNWFNINWPAELFSGGRKKIAAQGFSVGSGKFNLISKLGNLYKNWLNIPDGQIGWFPFALLRGDALQSGKNMMLYTQAAGLLHLSLLQ